MVIVLGIFGTVLLAISGSVQIFTPYKIQAIGQVVSQAP